MSMSTITTGRIAEPELRFTSNGKALLELRIAATRSQKDKQTGQWSDDGAPLWVAATFWEDEAQRLADALHKGDQVTVSGDLVLEEYQKRDGTPGQKHVLRFPRFLGVVPRRNAKPIQQANTASFGTPPDDPWGNTPQTPQNGTQATDQWGGPSNVAPF